jgi:hypothetical protein
MSSYFQSVDDAESAVEESDSRNRLRRGVDQIGIHLKSQLLQRYCEEHVLTLNDVELGKLRHIVDELLNLEQYGRLEAFLSNIPALGLEGALRELRAVEGGIVWRYLRASVLPLLEILLFALMLNACERGFQQLVIASLGIIYSLALFSFSTGQHYKAETFLLNTAALDRLRQLAKDRMFEADDAADRQIERSKALKKSEISFLVVAFKALIFEIIATIVIVKNVL